MNAAKHYEEMRERNMDGYEGSLADLIDRAQAERQASDLFTLQRAKEILCDLWKQGKIDLSLRSQGDCALAGAIEATENPSAHKLSPADGRRLAAEQWEKENERANKEF